MAGQKLDLSSEPIPNQKTTPSQPQLQRPFVGVRFDCCRTYARVYLNQDETAYAGKCPKCGGRVVFRVGPDGTDERFFIAS